MKKRIVCLAVVALCACAVAIAADKEKSAAEKLYDILTPKSTFITGFSSIFEGQLQKLQEMGIPQKQVDEVRQATVRFAESTVNDPEFDKQMVAFYSSTFTEPEMQDLIKFYETPTGKKALKSLPELMRKGATIGQELAKKHEAKFRQEIQAIMTQASAQQPAEKPAENTVPMEAPKAENAPKADSTPKADSPAPAK